MAADASAPRLASRLRTTERRHHPRLAVRGHAVRLARVNLWKTPADFFEVFLIGITTGCVYALVALGYTLVYGILELINFAHGDVFMLGGMFTITFATTSSACTAARAR